MTMHRTASWPPEGPVKVLVDDDIHAYARGAIREGTIPFGHRSTASIVRDHLDRCPTNAPPDPRAQFLVDALAGEAGELANVYKKTWRDGSAVPGRAPPNRLAEALDELADVGNYALMLAEHLGVDLLAICRAKLLMVEERPEYRRAMKEKVRAAREERHAG